MRILIFDTETTGFPSEKERIVQFAAHILKLSSDHAPLTVQEFCTLVKTDVPVHPAAFSVHGISQEFAEHGIEQRALANWFAGAANKADIVVAHNINFDMKFMNFLLDREGVEPPNIYKTICTMQESTNICAIPKARGTGYKWPKLEEALRILCGKDLVGAHDALADTRACRDVLMELLKRKAISL